MSSQSPSPPVSAPAAPDSPTSLLSSERRARAEAETALARAEAANQAKTRFLSTMSHEIRTPLNGVVGMIELLRGTRLDREQTGYVDTLSQSAEALLTIVNAVIDLSAIDSGQLERERRIFSPLRLAQETLALVRPHAQAKGLRLLLWCGELPERLVGEPARLQQVWMNLLSNAIKFTDRGEIRFDLLAEMPDANSHEARIRLHGRVSDSGRGIEREHQRQIIEAFTRSDITTPPGATGSGLGLSIASRLVRLMGGELTLESEPGVGSRFGFSLETTLPVESAEAAGQSGPQSIPIAALRVLVAEDNQINQLVAMTVLAKFGIQASLARDGIEAVEMARQDAFDVILMDVQMPRMDGIDATRAIRALPSASDGRRPWIIAVTANAFDQDRERCLAAGMDDFVSKPFRQEALRDALMQSARRHSQG
ncbi:MAG: response regulator [Burkholderiaceae bacterium]